MGLTLDENLSLIEKLQRAEARAVAAEKVIADAQKHWQITVGKTLDYSPMSKILQSLDLTAAREMMRKAEERDARIKQNEEQYRIHTQNTREWKEALDTLRRQLQEAEALSERRRAALADLENDTWTIPASIWNECMRSKNLTPADALSEYRREVLEEVAKLVIDHELCYLPATSHPETMSIGEALAAEIRAMGEGK